MEHIRQDTSKDFLKTNGPWYLMGAVILGSSGIIVDSSGPGAILLLLLSLMLFATSIQFIHSGGDRNLNSLTLTCTLGSCVLFAAAIFRLVAINPEALTDRYLRESALDLILQRPLFGWGFESFPYAAPFYNNDNLGNSLNLHAQSDYLHYLSEFGLFGCLAIVVFILTLAVRYFLSKKTQIFSNHLLIACLSVFIIALIDSPFMSPTVTLSFWVLFLCALRYGNIESTKVDEVDIEDAVMVSPASARRVPFFTGAQDEKEI
jgi:O-antigen ligase